MNSLHENMKQFDAYLFNEMNKAERVAFEIDLDSDAALKTAFDEHRKFLRTFNEGVEYKEIKKRLKSVHTSIYEPQKNFFTSKQFLIPLSIAAAFVLIMLAINPPQGNWSGTNEAEGIAPDYLAAADTATREYDVAAVSPTDDFMGNGLPEPAANLTPAISRQPEGTAFLISEKGYFLTAVAALNGNKNVGLQQQQLGFFQAVLVYADTTTGFAILHCNAAIMEHFTSPVPYKPATGVLKSEQELYSFVHLNAQPSLEYGTPVFSDCTATPNFKLILQHERHINGAPVFNRKDELAGIIIKNKSGKSVTNAVDYHYVQGVLDELYLNGSIPDLTETRTSRIKLYSDPEKRISPFIFEVHP